MHDAAAWAWYRPQPAPMAVAQDGRFAVDLGDPEPADAAALDPVVSLVARRVYHAAAPLAPADVYRYVTQGDLARDPWGAPFGPAGGGGGADGPPPAARGAAAAAAPPLHALHLPCNLLQHLAGAPACAHLGHPRATLHFPSRDAALLALAVDARHRALSGSGVLRLLAEASAAPPPRSLGRAVPALPPPRAARELAPADAGAPLPCVPSAEWGALLRAIEGAAADAEAASEGAAWRVPVLLLGAGGAAPALAATCLVVLAHWTARGAPGGALAHRALAACVLRPRPTGAGVCVELAAGDRAADGAWPPWWVDADARLLPAAARAVLAAGGGAGGGGGARRKRPWAAVAADVVADVERLLAPPDEGGAATAEARRAAAREHARRLGALRLWRRAALDDSVRAPVLDGTALVLGLADDERLATADGAYIAHRLHAEDEMRDPVAGVHGLLRAALGENFAGQVVARAVASRGRAGVYAVHAGAGVDAVAAFSVYLFDGTHPDGAAGAVLLVESLAVAPDHQRRGLGGAVFRELCLPIAARRSARYVVAAQCVRGREATFFWGSRLDDSAAARAVILQAIAAAPASVVFEDSCTPRAREYVDGVVTPPTASPGGT